MPTTELITQPESPPMAPPPNFPATWACPADARLCWTLDRAHWPDPMPPLVFAIAGEALALGLGRAARAYERPSDIRVQRINTYRYQATVPLAAPPEAAEAQEERSRAKVRAVMAQLSAVWTSAWLPEITAHLSDWERFDLAGAPLSALRVHLDETVAWAVRLWEIHFLLHAPMHSAIRQFGRLYRELFGGTALDAYRLLQGFPNRSLAMGQALRRLSRQARASQSVRAIIAAHSPAAVLPALEHSIPGRAFRAELLAYLHAYGHRREKLSLDSPSWIEDPTPVINTLKIYLAQPDHDLEAEVAALAQERERLVATARERLGGYPQPVVAEFEFLLRAAQEATVLSEDHNDWLDFRCLHQVRRIFLEFGRRFVAAGVLESQPDIFYLTLDELRQTAALRPQLAYRTLVSERRADLERFWAVDPPLVLGTPPPAPDAAGRAASKRGGTTADPSDQCGVLRGHAGSAGIARGPARVICGTDAAAQVGAGEILVAATITPAWTPLFAAAAAVVTDSGGILSHCAIVAREYRIPAVVGTGSASTRIRDGQLLEVDGSAGIVRIVTSA